LGWNTSAPPPTTRSWYAEFGITAERAARAAHTSLATVTAAGGRR
jgi:hypothetical protein